MGYELLEDCTHAELMDMVLRHREALREQRAEVKRLHGWLEYFAYHTMSNAGEYWAANAKLALAGEQPPEVG